MKKILTILTLSILLLGMVSAQELIINKAGITPDSPLWGIDRAMEKVRYAFAFNKQKKLAYGIEIVEERLAEMEQMREQNKLGELEKIEEQKQLMEQKLNKIKLSELTQEEVDLFQSRLKSIGSKINLGMAQ